MRKSGGFLLVLLLTVSVVSVVVYSYFVFVSVTEKPLLAPIIIDFPMDCSSSEIQGIWEDIFKVSSDSLYIVTNGSASGFCPSYYAYKNLSNNQTFVMGGHSGFNNSISDGPYLEVNTSFVFYFYGNLSSVDTAFLNFTSETVGSPFFTLMLISVPAYFEEVSYNWSQTPIMPDQEVSFMMKYLNATPYVPEGDYFVAGESSSGTFSVSGTNKTLGINSTSYAWVSNVSQVTAYMGTTTHYIMCEPNWTCTNWSACNGTVQNRTCSDQGNCGILYGKPAITQPCSLGCTPNWAPINATPCNATESFVVWYNDTNNCPNVTRPANGTGYCDYDKNNLIGRLNDIVDVNLEISNLKIDGKDVNYSMNYTGNKRVQLIEEEDTDIVRVSFLFNFNEGPLNLKIIRIEKQEDDDDFGYLIVRGLEVENKDFRVDKVLGMNSVCVQDDSFVNYPNDISEDCDGSNEYDIPCPGRRSGFNCSDGGDGTYLVKGLDHSGVRELDFVIQTPPSNPPTDTSCTPSWSCGAWGACVNNVETRVCTDYSACPNATKSYNETRVCNATCTPNWECGAWAPADCKSGEEQTQLCTDANGCLDNQTRMRDCLAEGGSISWALIGIIIGAVVVVLAAIILIIIVRRRQDKHGGENSISPIQMLTKPPVGSFTPTHYGGFGGYRR